MEGLEEFEVIREDNHSDAEVLQVFQIYDRWSAEEMKNFALFSVVNGDARDWHSEMFRDGLLILEAQGRFVECQW